VSFGKLFVHPVKADFIGLPFFPPNILASITTLTFTTP
jgi:hypothetical protein